MTNEILNPVFPKQNSIAGSDRKEGRWCPDECPITGRPFFLWMNHPDFGYVPTYGGPYDSYTLAERHPDGSYYAHRYDHDEGGWIMDEVQDCGVRVVED